MGKRKKSLEVKVKNKEVISHNFLLLGIYELPLTREEEYALNLFTISISRLNNFPTMVIPEFEEENLSRKKNLLNYNPKKINSSLDFYKYFLSNYFPSR